jgi:hypothetical protein
MNICFPLKAFPADARFLLAIFLSTFERACAPLRTLGVSGNRIRAALRTIARLYSKNLSDRRNDREKSLSNTAWLFSRVWNGLRRRNCTLPACRILPRHFNGLLLRRTTPDQNREAAFRQPVLYLSVEMFRIQKLYAVRQQRNRRGAKLRKVKNHSNAVASLSAD